MVSFKDLKIKIFADGADIESMKKMYKSGKVQGFTTNPYFLRLAGVTDYKGFAEEVVREIPDMPVSFEVISDDLETMEKEARIVSGWGENIYVKIPVTNTRGVSTAPIIKNLTSDGLKLNVTVIYTVEQVKEIASSLLPDVESIVSIFAGRIGETGVDPMPIVKEASQILKSMSLEKAELLWASTREIFNIFQAEECGCKIITIGDSILEKLDGIGIRLEDASLDTIKTFYECAQKSGYKI